MSVLRVYELHTYRDGAWKIDSVFDDRDLAMMEAERVDRGGRYSAVRLVEETYDDATQKSGTRTLFRSTKADRVNAINQARRSEGMRMAAPPPAKRPVARRKGMTGQLVLASFLLVLIAGGGLGLLYLLSMWTGAR